MDRIGKAARYIRTTVDSEVTEWLRWANTQTAQENGYTVSTWVPQHLRGLMKFINDLRLGEGPHSQNGQRIRVQLSSQDKCHFWLNS